MRLTSFGAQSVTFYVALVGAFYASPYSNTFFLLLAFLTLVGVAGWMWSRANMRRVDGAVLEPPPLVAGKRCEVPARLSVDGRGGAFQVSVQLELEGGQKLRTQVPWVRGEVSLSLEAPKLPRGIHPVAKTTVSSSYPFDLLRFRRTVPGPAELVVYPAPSEVVSARTGAGALADLSGGRIGGEGDLQPSGLRDHREGEGLRGVHWRATARRGKLVVCDWEGGVGQGLEVLIDRRCEPEALEEALSFVSALVVLARANKEVLAIYSQDLVATYGEGHGSWNDALRFLAGATVLPKGAAAPPPVSPSVKRVPLARARKREVVHGS